MIRASSGTDQLITLTLSLIHHAQAYAEGRDSVSGEGLSLGSRVGARFRGSTIEIIHSSYQDASFVRLVTLGGSTCGWGGRVMSGLCQGYVRVMSGFAYQIPVG